MGTGVADAEHDPRPQPRRRLRTFVGVIRLAGPYFAFAGLRHVVRVETLVRWAWRDPTDRPRNPNREELTVAHATKLRHLFDRSDRGCLSRSLTLYRALARAGASPQLWIGFRKLAGRVDGHAWVTVDGRAVGEAEAGLASLTPTCGFGAHGEPIVPTVETGRGAETDARNERD